MFCETREGHAFIEWEGDVGLDEDVVGGGGPADGEEVAPLRSFIFEQVNQVLEDEADGWFAAGLGEDLGVLGFGPVVDLDAVLFVGRRGEAACVCTLSGKHIFEADDRV